ncbi:MAG TPA: tetratricopeptide repeat protein [Thermoanaerobaculia bacterium]|nr:tetratricopeptide repeat protein [Thermoanaerobaculia bacterium]
MTHRNRNGLFLSMAIGLSLFAGSSRAAGSKSEEGIQLFEARKFDEARASLEAAVREDPQDARAASYLGRVYLAVGNSDRAVQWMGRSVALESANAEYHLWLGRAFGNQAMQASVLKQPSLARKVKKEFEEASRLDPDNLEARFGLIEFYLRAPGVLGGSPKKADEQAEEICRRDLLQGYRARGRIAEHRKDFDRALAQYDAAAREFPEKTEPFYWIGALLVRENNYAEAFEVYEKLLEENPSEMTACYQIGRVASLSGLRLERGKECLTLYLQHEPNPDEPSLASAHYRLGLLYEKSGNRDLARREYSAALDLEPALPDARKALKKVS